MCSFAQIDFLPFQSIEVGSYAKVVAIGDINHDSKNDIVVGTAYYFDPENDYSLFVFIQNAQGELNPPLKFPYTPSYPGIRSIDLSDVNNDGRTDVIIGFSDSIGIFYQTFPGTLSPMQSYYSGSTVDGTTCGDLNNDGLMDIAVSHWNDPFIRVFYQTDANVFNEATYESPGIGIHEIELGDLNGDGLQDLVLMCGGGIGGVHVYHQNNQGTLSSYISYFPNESSWDLLHGIAVGDLNNDGSADIAATMGGNTPSSKLVVWLQVNTTGTLQSPPIELGAYHIPEPLVIADFNCDQHNELITVHGGFSKLSIYEQDSMSNYGSYTLFTVPHFDHYNPHGLAVGDINRDGKKDIAIADMDRGLVFLLNNSSPDQLEIISQTVTTDTLSSNLITNLNQFTTTNITSENSYQNIQIDSFFVTSRIIESTLTRDSIIISMAEFCGSSVIDTIRFTETYTTINILSSDTIKKTGPNDLLNTTPELKIYPNPTNGLLTIEIPIPLDSKKSTIQLFNSLGSLIFHEDYDSSENKRYIDLSHFANGVYFIQVSLQDFTSRPERIIKIE